MNIKTFAILMMVAFGALSAPITPALAAGTPGLTIVGGDMTFDGDGPWTLGWAFKASTSQTLIGLGAYDLGGDGFLTDHQVGLWDTNGTLLASVIVGSSDPLINGFRFASITPYTLSAGSTYIVGAANLGTGDGYSLYGEVATAPGITYLSSRYIDGSGLQLPTAYAGVNPGYFGGNILLGSAVPEPAVWAMMIIGFGAVGSMVRARRRQSALA